MKNTMCFAFLGVAFHLSILPLEIDYQILRLLCLSIALWVILVWTNCQYYDASLLSAIKMVSGMSICFNTGLTISMVIYRVFLHRLRSFPGPFAARVSKLYAFTLQWKSWQYFSDQVVLQHKYGDFVRTGRLPPTHFASLMTLYRPSRNHYIPPISDTHHLWLAIALHQIRMVSSSIQTRHRNLCKHHARPSIASCTKAGLGPRVGCER